MGSAEYDPEFGMGDHMFTDLTLSRELMAGFLEGEERRGDTSRLQKMNVMVLQRSAWPFAARKTDIDLPRWVRFPVLIVQTIWLISKTVRCKMTWRRI